MEEERVSLLKCNTYAPALLDDIIERHMEQINPTNDLIQSGTKVLIKPNLLMRRRPEDATTTHPAFVAAVVRAVKRRGGVVTIADSPGGLYNKSALHSIYAATGMEQVAREEGATLNYDTATVERVNEDGVLCRHFEIITPAVQADMVISVGKLKTHAMTNYTGAVKNLFGVVPGLSKPEFHFRFPNKKDFGQMIVDLCETVSPTLSFVDGIVGMEGNGPSGGKAKAAGLTGASLNPHALDLLLARLIGFAPSEVPTLRAAVERRLCPVKISDLDIVGDRAEQCICHFERPDSSSTDFMENIRLPGFLRKPIRRLLTPRPEVRKADCIGCGKCAESCPRQVIHIENKKAHIYHAHCIRCFCCQEMCPVKAIDIRKFALFGG